MLVPVMPAAEAVDVVGHLGEPRAENVDHLLDTLEQLLVRQSPLAQPCALKLRRCPLPASGARAQMQAPDQARQAATPQFRIFPDRLHRILITRRARWPNAPGRDHRYDRAMPTLPGGDDSGGCDTAPA